VSARFSSAVAAIVESVQIELVQMQTGRGPRTDCYRTGRAHSVSDITAERERWPHLVTALTGAGYRFLRALPVRLPERTLGALTLLDARTANMPADDLHLAQALADLAALSLTHRATEPRPDDVITLVNRTMEPALILGTRAG
jgi:GAF domain-containing protein